MDPNKIKIDDFFSLPYYISFYNLMCKPLPNNIGFIKNKNQMVLFKQEYIEDAQPFLDGIKKIILFNMSEDNYDLFLKRGIKHAKSKNDSIISIFDGDFFKLEGKKHRHLRYRRNHYTKRFNFEVRDSVRSMYDFDIFIKKWNNMRKDAHFQLHTGYDVRFIKENLNNYKDKLVQKWFYDDNELVGYSVVDRASNGKYNLLCRKAFTDEKYTDLCMYMDYCVFKLIYDDIKKPYLVNMGAGQSGVKQYKETKFPYFASYKLITAKYDVVNDQVVNNFW